MALKRLKWLKYLFINREEGETEQTYWNEKRKKHLANEHAEGVVLGLEVIETAAPSLSVRVNAGRAIDTEGHDPEVESIQQIDCSALVPGSGEELVFITLRYTSVETDPYFVNEIGQSQPKFIQDSFVLEATPVPPTAPVLELARVRLGAGATAIRDAADPKAPGLNEIDRTQVKFSGKEVGFLRELADVSDDEADAFNAMEDPSAGNPVATMSAVDAVVEPVRDEVAAARGSKGTLDARLDTMLNEDGSFKGITKITPASPLTGGGTAGDVALGITDATQTQRGAMSAADKFKLDTLLHLGGVRGCRLAWVDEQNIRVEPGQISLDGQVRFITAGVNINLTLNLESGQTATDKTWYYVYVRPDPAPATSFTAFLSKTIPGASGKHPDGTAFFIGSVRRGEAKFRCFIRSKHMTVWRDAAGSGAFAGLENQNDIVNGAIGSSKTVSVADFMPPTASAILVMYDVEAHVRVRPAAHVALGASGMGFEGFGAVQEGPYILIPDKSFQLNFTPLGGGTTDAHRVGSYGYFEDIDNPVGPFGSA